jgi:hypothetical protein
MNMKIVKGRRTGETQLQTSEYAPKGPVTLAKRTLLPPVPPSQFKVAVPAHARHAGWLYDWHSGISLGVASDELRAQHKPGVPFDRTVAGVKQRVEIHP